MTRTIFLLNLPYLILLIQSRINMHTNLKGSMKTAGPIGNSKKKLPHFDILEQEKLLKIQILEYFEQEMNFH